MLAVPLVGVIADLYGRRSVLIPSLLSFGTSGVATLIVTITVYYSSAAQYKVSVLRAYYLYRRR